MDANTATIVTAFLNSFGVPAFILGVLAFFAYKALWPFAVKRIEAGDVERKSRHDDYLKWQGEIAESMASTARILDRIEERMTNHEEATAQRVDSLKKETSAASVSLKEFIDARQQILLREVQIGRGGK